MFCLILGTSLFFSTFDPLEVAKKHTLNGDYEKSALILDQMIPNSKNHNDYYYYSLINHFKLNQKDKALKDVKNLEMTFNKFNRRQDALIFMMTEDLKNWESGDLSDIARDMGNSGDRLRIAKSGQETQRVQKEIVDKLDRLIKQQEDKMKSASDSKDNSSGSDKSPSGGANKVPIGQPAPDSIIMGGKGEGKIDDVKLRKIGESWGTLPPAARAKVVREITRELPPRFEELIKSYFESLDKLHGYKR